MTDGAATPPRDVVGFDHFAGLDLRIGRVTAVDPFPEARQPSWQLTIDLGPALGVRRSSAQLTSYPAEDLLDRQVVCVTNIGTRRIAGFLSEVLVLAALAPDGTPRLLAPDIAVPPGSVVA